MYAVRTVSLANSTSVLAPDQEGATALLMNSYTCSLNDRVVRSHVNPVYRIAMHLYYTYLPISCTGCTGQATLPYLTVLSICQRAISRAPAHNTVLTTS